MKVLWKASLLSCVAILFAAATCLAQEPASQNSDLIRVKIEELEKVDLQTKSTTVQEIYRKSLLRLYQQYSSALQQDVADLKKLQSTIGQTDPEAQKDITAQLQKLSVEQNVTTEKIKTLGGNVETSAASETNGAGADGVAQDPKPTNVASPKRMLSVVPVTTPTSAGLGTTSTGTAAQATTTITLCGQIKPASLIGILALARSNPELRETQILMEHPEFRVSWLGDKCENPNPQASTLPRVQEDSGSQRDKVTEVLRKLLDELGSLSTNKDAKRHGPGFSGVSPATIKREILLLNGYIGNAIVRVQKEGEDEPLTPRADKDGNYTVDVGAGTYTISTEADNYYTKRTVTIKDGDDDVRMDIPIEDRPVSLLTRAIVGYEQSGAAAAKNSQNYFFDLFISKSFPFKQKIDPDFGERLRTWVDFRFASVPQTGDVSLGDFTTGFATQVKNLKVKDAARVLEFMGGLEYRLSGNAGLLPSFDRLTKQKFSLSLIGGGGFTTPTNPLDSITVFKVSPGAPGLPPQAVGKDFVAFVQSDRDKFFRQYYVGLRMQTFFFNLFNMPMQRFPAQLDVAIGQNEYVTGGKLKGPVVRIDGFFPLPYDGLKFINIFGTALLRPGHSVTGIPLVLQAAPDGTAVPAPNAVLITLPQPNRDYYRVGFGIDLMSLIQKWAPKQ